MEPSSPARRATSHRREPARPQSLMQLTISADCMRALLTMLNRSFAGLVRQTGAQALDHARKVKLSLCMEATLVPRLIGAVLRSLPSAEIGRITHV